MHTKARIEQEEQRLRAIAISPHASEVQRRSAQEALACLLWVLGRPGRLPPSEWKEGHLLLDDDVADDQARATAEGVGR